MEINGVTPSNALQAVLAALAEIATAEAVAAQGEAASALASTAEVHGLSGMPGVPGQPIGAGHAVEHGPMRASAESDVHHPDARPDKGAETALVQSFARANTPAAEASQHGDRATAAIPPGGSDFTLPGDQLLNAAVIGLQVVPAFAWPLQQRGCDAAPAEAPTPRAEAPAAQPAADQDADQEATDDDAATPAEEHTSVAPRSGVVPDDSADDDWSEPLSRALREALRLNPGPQALQAAAEQWRLGRCVVLVCPQGTDPAGPAWAFVLWPRPGARAGALLALFGVRVDARLHWARLPPVVDWCHARVMKEQHPRQGRQLVALDARGTATVPCEVQLGPVPLRTPRWRDACVRIDAVRRFWSALGEQWSVTVVVGARPLPGVRAPGLREAAC